ncbi:hypothetical protein QUF72_11525 [Desulfobacterales bacterium HSG2]|nr:hypothetical protein [Desulfobacterales bacterium HSG2]
MKKSAQTVFLVIFAIFTLTGMAFAGALPDTGQTKCYNDTAEIPAPHPARISMARMPSTPPTPAPTPRWMQRETPCLIPAFV